MKKVIISGATGQTGSYMAEYLLKNTDHTIILAIRRTSQAIISNLKDILPNPRIKMATMDLADPHSVENLIRDEKPDYFLNFGAQSFVADSWASPALHLQVNAISLVHILESVRKHAPHCHVYSSGSSEQWGDVKYSPQDENHPMSPRSVYGVSKCAASHICKVYRESYGLYVVHGVLLNHESERRQSYFVSRKCTLGVARIAKAISQGKSFDPIELGNLDAKRDWSHAEDFVDGIWRMVNQETFSSVIPDSITNVKDPVALSKAIATHLKEYVLSSGTTQSIRKLCELAFKAAGIDLIWAREDAVAERVKTMGPTDRLVAAMRVIDGIPTGDALIVINPAFFRPADVELLWGDSTRARAELGWQPKVSFPELVERMVKSDLAAEGIV